MSFRICTWNCRGKLAEKSYLFDEIKPDLLISQEGSAADSLFISKNRASIFTPKQINTNERVLAATSFSETIIRKAPLPKEWGKMLENDPGRMDVMMPIEILSPIRVNILTVWSFNNRTRLDKKNLRGPIFCALDYLGDWLSSENSMVIGDFNHHPAFDKYTNVNQFRKLIEMMEQRNLVSLYHSSTGENHGLETRATHLHQGKNPFHIDYIFASSNICKSSNFHIMSFEKMKELGILSDHVPLWVDIHQPL